MPRKGPPLNFSVSPCDLYFCRSDTILSHAIRVCETGWNEPPAECSHVGGFVTANYWDEAYAVEALRTVDRHHFGQTYTGSGNEILIARPVNLNPDQTAAIVRVAEGMVGMKYGYLKIAAHLADAALGGANVFRRLCFVKSRPICSWVWASAFLSAGLDFGCDARVAQPDDMLDFVRANPDKYQILREFEAY